MLGPPAQGRTLGGLHAGDFSSRSSGGSSLRPRGRLVATLPPLLAFCSFWGSVGTCDAPQLTEASWWSFAFLRPLPTGQSDQTRASCPGVTASRRSHPPLRLFSLEGHCGECRGSGLPHIFQPMQGPHQASPVMSRCELGLLETFPLPPVKGGSSQCPLRGMDILSTPVCHQQEATPLPRPGRDCG